MVGELKRFSARLVILMLRGYKRFISPCLPAACRFDPTCSEYAREAIEKHGLSSGSWLAVKRVLRCHPWNEGGFDPVPNNFQEKSR